MTIQLETPDSPGTHATDVVSPVLQWRDRARRLVFSWTGEPDEPIQVEDYTPGGPPIGDFTIPAYAVRRFNDLAGGAVALATLRIFKSVCQDYEPVLNRPVRPEVVLMDDLGFALAKAGAFDAGDAELALVVEAAQDVVDAYQARF